MKTQKKNGQGLYLQTSNKRWKWMAGATAATAAAGVTASQASTITINLVGNFINDGGNHLNADLTGDGHPDLTIANAFNTFFYGTSYRVGFASARVNINGVLALARETLYDGGISLLLGSHFKSVTYFPTYRHFASLTGSIPVFFKDLRINGGAPTRGSLEVTVFAGGQFSRSAEVQLDSLTYNTPGQGSRLGLAVPEQGSSLALLAMGATGILALRRWRAGQGRS